MTRRSNIPPALAAAPFAVAHAKEAGLSAGRIRAADLERPFHGVRQLRGLGAHPLRSYLERMSPHAFFSHATAAHLWGMPLPERLRGRQLHVCVVKPARAPRIAGVIGHHYLPGSVSVIARGRVRLAAADDTWCALSTMLTLDELVVAGDWLVKRKEPIATLDQLNAAVSAYTGRPGARLLADAMALVRARTDSPRETRLRLILVRAGLPDPVVNFTILDADGVFVAYGDLAYPRYKVLVEYDGAHHREDEAQFNRDVDRLDDIMQVEWRVVRINKSHSRAQIVAKATAALRSRGWIPPRSGTKRG